MLAAMNLSDRMLRSILYDTDSESSSDSEVDEVEIRRRLQVRGSQKDKKPARIVGYVEITIPRLSPEDFRKHFRMSRTCFDRLETLLAPSLMAEVGSKGRVPVRKQLLGTLWLLATPDSYRSVGDRFDLAKSTLSGCFMRVVVALNNLADEYIKWPRNVSLQRVKEHFNMNTVLRGIIGAIDGTHILIKAPKKDSQFYKTYKKTFAIILQAICDGNMVFTDCFAGFAGSVMDLRVLRNSDIFQEINANKERFFPDNEFIIGDKAYPVLSWLIPPYIDRGQLTEGQKRCNRALSSKRSIIERAFALLKGRFRRLKMLDMNRDDVIPQTILACTVLHNICLQGLDDENVDDFIEEGRVAPEEHIIHDEGIANEEAGEAKRNYLCALC